MITEQIKGKEPPHNTFTQKLERSMNGEVYYVGIRDNNGQWIEVINKTPHMVIDADKHYQTGVEEKSRTVAAEEKTL